MTDAALSDAVLTMRPAREEDLPALVALLVDDKWGRLRDDPAKAGNACYIDAFRAIDADPNQMLIAAERDGRIVGMMQLSFLPGLSYCGAWRGQIESVRIAASERGRGLGSRMIEWALERFRERNVRTAQLTSVVGRVDAHRFYERLGFTASHVGMKKDLTAEPRHGG
jgi:GNAT superfamily N-acetyltransferase